MPIIPVSSLLLLCTLVLLAARVIHGANTFDKQCGILMEDELGDCHGQYSKVIEPTLSPSHLQDLPGFTRSMYTRDHALITPESQVFSSLPGWQKTTAAYLISPAMGSHFSMYLAKMEADSLSGLPAIDVERFIFVLKGDVMLFTSSEGSQKLSVDSFVYLPPNVAHSLQCKSSAAILIYEKRYQRVGNEDPKVIAGTTNAQPLLETPGEVFVLRKLLPTSEVYDFNIHVMDFEPGDFLNVKEVHYNQHGLLMLEGGGIYRLGDHW
ncbi:hypothetical protein GOP47_0021368 [Adiantum capillus-veneris]|uniref:(S)-ureidoglycine aminohydrolase n=1 Tax=Adiantum capillus-veneris TaxID=13818 RepID=A0A9D4U9G5_ADICA|nr:hypothetical protein GOP47_0021368 [Adiantum capillus-veneris]